jgi:hypothetical protein
MSGTEKLANPAPLGPMGFAITTILLNLHNAGITALSATILAMGLMFGGLAQLLVGVMEWKKGNTFGTTAFTSYGCFWLGLVLIILMPNFGIGAVAATKMEMAWFLGLWGVFTLFLFVGTLKTNRTLQFVFGSLVALFFLLVIGDATGVRKITVLAGYVGIICGASAFYTAMAQVLGESLGKDVLPTWPVKPKADLKRVKEAGAEPN